MLNIGDSIFYLISFAVLIAAGVGIVWLVRWLIKHK